jgi:hypothetical protein
MRWLQGLTRWKSRRHCAVDQQEEEEEVRPDKKRPLLQIVMTQAQETTETTPTTATAVITRIVLLISMNKRIMRLLVLSSSSSRRRCFLSIKTLRLQHKLAQSFAIAEGPPSYQEVTSFKEPETRISSIQKRGLIIVQDLPFKKVYGSKKEGSTVSVWVGT